MIMMESWLNAEYNWNPVHKLIIVIESKFNTIH